MKKLLRLFSILLVMAFVAPAIQAATAEFTPSDFTATESDLYEAIVDGVKVTITNNVNSGNNGMGYGSPMRWYKNAVITISSENKIDGIAFTASSTAYATALSKGSVDTGVLAVDDTQNTVVKWSGSAATKIVITNSSAQARVSSFVVTYIEAAGTVTKPTFNPDGGLVNVGTTVSVTADETVYVATESEVGENPTNEDVFDKGSEMTSFVVNAPGTYYAIAIDDNLKMSSVAKATFDVLYNDGTEEHPYTVEEAIKVANVNGTSSTTYVYVHGYVCNENFQANSDGSYTFNMSANEDLSGDLLKAYKVTSTETVSGGDIVTVCGPLCMYGKTPEVNTGTVTYVGGKRDAEIAWSADEYTWTVGTSTAADLPTLTNPHEVGIEYTSSNTEVATIAANGTISIEGDGVTTITATVAVNDNYKVNSVSYTLTVFDPNKKQDVLTADNITDFGKYGNYTYTSDNGVTYQIFGYKNSGIQINANSGHEASGIIVTKNADGYALKSIKIEASTIGSVPVAIYGTNKVNSGTSDIDNANTDARENGALGTLIGTITEAGTFTFTPNADYRYICICPSKRSSGSSVLTSVTIDWKVATTALDYPTVTVAAAGYSSLYYGEDNLIVPEGLVGYTYTVSGETAIATESYKAGDIIPAGEGVLLYSEAGGDFTLVETITGANKVEGNCLRGTDATELVEAGTDETLYILAKPANGPRGFYKASADGKSFTNNAHKAYLAVTTGASKAPKYIGLPNGGQSGIVNVIVDGDADANAPAYNVMGQKVTNDYKGFVIKNGKKMYNK